MVEKATAGHKMIKRRMTTRSQKASDASATQFDELAFDVQVLIAEYLTIKERVGTERVSHTFQDVMKKVNSKQTALVLRHGCAIDCSERKRRRCNNLKHFIPKTSYVADSHNVYIINTKMLKSLIPRLPSLKVFIWETNSKRGFGRTAFVTIGETLRDNCENLEHVAIYSSDPFAKELLFTLNVENLVCLMAANLRNDRCWKYRVDMEPVIPRCSSKLDYFAGNPNHPDVTNFALQHGATQLRCTLVGPQFTKLNLEVARHLISLDVELQQTDDVLKVIKHCPNLKHIFVGGRATEILQPFHQLAKLESFKWAAYYHLNNTEKEVALENFREFGPRLKTLNVSGLPNDVSFMRQIVQCCPNLEDLSLRMYCARSNIKKITAGQILDALPKLRNLELLGEQLGERHLKRQLEKHPSLRFLKCNNYVTGPMSLYRCLQKLKLSSSSKPIDIILD